MLTKHTDNINTLHTNSHHLFINQSLFIKSIKSMHSTWQMYVHTMYTCKHKFGDRSCMFAVLHNTSGVTNNQYLYIHCTWTHTHVFNLNQFRCGSPSFSHSGFQQPPFNTQFIYVLRFYQRPSYPHYVRQILKGVGALVKNIHSVNNSCQLCEMLLCCAAFFKRTISLC